MAFSYLGENVAILRDLPPEQRRIVYRAAVKRSYSHGRTWVGLLAFLFVACSTDSLTEAVTSAWVDVGPPVEHFEGVVRMAITFIAWGILWQFQRSAVLAELRKDVAQENV